MTVFPVSDGTIESITCEHENLFVEFLDWQEQLWMVTFQNVLAFKAIGAVGCEVSEMYEEDVTSLSEEVRALDASEVGTSYCFAAARDNNVILTIVASGYMAEKCP
ncbi:hypothetical protein [Pseudomonas rossensis]|uniref:hypothetical protein n=1 Tax=Pseudomonas rossensis TaxID=2305471 RepID=UPI0032614F8E